VVPDNGTPTFKIWISNRFCINVQQVLSFVNINLKCYPKSKMVGEGLLLTVHPIFKIWKIIHTNKGRLSNRFNRNWHVNAYSPIHEKWRGEGGWTLNHPTLATPLVVPKYCWNRGCFVLYCAYYSCQLFDKDST